MIRLNVDLRTPTTFLLTLTCGLFWSCSPSFFLPEFPRFRFRIVPCCRYLLAFRQTVHADGGFRSRKRFSNNLITSLILCFKIIFNYTKVLWYTVNCGICMMFCVCTLVRSMRSTNVNISNFQKVFKCPRDIKTFFFGLSQNHRLH